MKLREHYKRIGKLGADKRWASRYEILVELSRRYDKEISDQFVKWPTKYLKQLLAISLEVRKVK